MAGVIPEQPLLRPYWSNRERFTIVDDLLLYDERLVIPVNLRMDMLNKIHHGHLGMTKCRARAQQSVWWPGLSLAIQDLVGNCQTCKEQLPDQREPLMASPLPDKAWERVGSDLFEYRAKTYLLMVFSLDRSPSSQEIGHQRNDRCDEQHLRGARCARYCRVRQWTAVCVQEV